MMKKKTARGIPATPVAGLVVATTPCMGCGEAHGSHQPGVPLGPLGCVRFVAPPGYRS